MMGDLGDAAIKVNVSDVLIGCPVVNLKIMPIQLGSLVARASYTDSRSKQFEISSGFDG